MLFIKIYIAFALYFYLRGKANRRGCDMLDKLVMKNKKMYKVMVIATVSSGKSTLINSFLGGDVLPSKNEACTAKPFVIINDEAKAFEAAVYGSDGKMNILKKLKDNYLDMLNRDSRAEAIFLEYKSKELINGKKSVALIDTPGVNNSRDTSHYEKTYSLLEKMTDGLLLYVINSTQIGIEDDRKLLSKVLKKLIDNRGKLDVIFAVNKVDEFDLEKEELPKILNDVKKYIKSCQPGFELFFSDEELDRRLFPISALSAKLIRKKLKGDILTRVEQKSYNYVEFYEYEQYHYEKYAKLSDSLKKRIDDKINAIKGNDEKAFNERALIHSGVPVIEEAINEYVRNS